MRYSHLLIGGAIGISACQTSAGPNEGLHTTVSLDRTNLTRGEVVEITVAVAGGTLQGSSTCLTGFSVLDARGNVVAPGDVACTDDLVTVSATESPYVRRFQWAGNTASGTSATPLPAGTYRIVGGPGPTGRTQGSLSAPVRIELTD
jgi:hypothetical protein